MEKFSEFINSLPKSAIVSLIAVTIVILPIWIATGISDSASRVSFFALAIALPMLILEFGLCQLPLIFFRSNINKVLHTFIQIVGPEAAIIGVIAAIWHVSQPVAIVFIISFVICAIIIVCIVRSTLAILQDEKEKLEEYQKIVKRKLQS